MHKMYEVMLRQYPLVYALDGRQALERLREHPDVDLVLLDINMPNMNGLESFAQLRSDGARPDVTVVIISTAGARRTPPAGSRPAPTPTSRSRSTAKRSSTSSGAWKRRVSAA